MLITPDHLSEAARAIIRTASQAELERVLRRAERTHRLLMIMLFASALAALGFALATRKLTWALVLPFIMMSAMAGRTRVNEVDLMKVALNPAVIDEIRNEDRARESAAQW